jgi:hydroxypyruvate reductase
MSQNFPAGTPDRALLEELFRAAVAAVDPGPAVAAALESGRHAAAARGHRLWIVALGKAVMPMARAAVEVAHRDALTLAGGLIVAPAAGQSPHASIAVAVGDHPEPAEGSLAAAAALGRLTTRVRPGDHVWILLSGGTTSLIGAPLDGIPHQQLRDLYRILLGSGLDISAMNRVRKRFTRWGGGKLAAALTGATVRQFIVSDVIGDDLPSIGSGPCVPDLVTASAVRQALESGGLWSSVPGPLRSLLQETEDGTRPETPKADHPAFASVRTEIVSSSRLAVESAGLRAAALGLIVETQPTPLEGEASQAGISVAATLRNYSQAPGTQGAARRCVILGGETTVTLGSDPGLGGRSQELALAAARELAGLSRVALLAAGTDGRDGPTDAAGAVVDGTTWAAIAAAGRDPLADLARHDAYPALDAAGALFRPGLTGTNVMDLVIGLS